jgi:hypothetical protein
MTTTRNVAVLLALTMVGAIVFGFATAETGAAGELFANAWGVVSLVDLYLSFAAVWAWIAWREQDVGRAVLWAVLIATLGAVAIWGYVALAAVRAGSAEELLLGSRATD